jgi:phosphoglycerate kinase
MEDEKNLAKFLTMDDFNYKDKVVLLRVDFNSPIDPNTKKILDDTRIRSHSETVAELSKKGAKVVILAHQGRPGDPDYSSLENHAKALSKIINKPVNYVDDIYGEKAKKAIEALKPGEILVLKNVRDYPEETKSKSPEEHAKSELVQKLAPLADFFVNDAFAAAHRGHASIVGFTVVLPTAAGRVMEKELKALEKVTTARETPCLYILGGAKADDSAAITEYVLSKGTADNVLTGGVIGHLFLYAKGYDIGETNRKYLEEKGFTAIIPKIQDLFKRFDGKIVLPDDLAVEVDGKRREIDVSELPTSYPIYDIGSKTIEKYASMLKKAKAIVVNGPMGVYENKEFLKGTKGVFEAIAESKAFSVAGGGHTVGALDELGLQKRISYVSTGGGALMEFLTGKTLPGVDALEKAKRA